jgi:electron transfer flavoprotein alpha subunit
MNKKSAQVCVFSERHDILLELLSIGSKLAKQAGAALTSVSIGQEAKSNAEEQIACGAEKVQVVENPELEVFQTELYTEALCQIVQQQKPEILLMGATKRGLEVAARLSQRLGAGCASECTDLAVGNENLIVERRYYAKFIAKQIVKSSIKIATIQPRRFEAPARDPSRTGIVEKPVLQLIKPRTKVIGIKAKVKSKVEIEKAEIIVSIGRGLKNKDDIGMIEMLAETLRGVVASSRPITDDLQWLPDDVKVGLSGHTVKPALYIACGISGQIEHIVGMRDAKIVVCINSDPKAPIIQESDYIVIGDLYQVVPALTEVIREMIPI